MDFLLEVQNSMANRVLQDIRKAKYETIQRDVFGYTEYEEEEKEKPKNNFTSKYK